MSYKFFVLWLFPLLVKLTLGDFCTYSRQSYYTYYTSCGLWGWSRCANGRWNTVYYSACCRGWQGYQCNIPVCTTPCYNGGTCVGPEKCSCPTSYKGDNCQTLLCSSTAPCYPGICSYPHNCTCLDGFTNSASGCLTFSSGNNTPIIQRCELELANVRRTDGKQLFFYSMPCGTGVGNETKWSNQGLFNYVKFSMDSYYQPSFYLPAPTYVTSHGFGIVYSGMHITHTKYPRPVDFQRFQALNTTYVCSSFSDDHPENNTAQCTKEEQNYKINIEHDDIFTVTFITKNGGFRQLYDTDNNRHLPVQHYIGLAVTKTIEVMFDFEAPVHCSEVNASTKCSRGETPINVGKDITKLPIHTTWDGWSDGLSGIAYYYMEIFELQPNIHNELTELEPLKPIFTFRKNKTSNIDFPTFTPNDTGMYSILLQASDMANNSKIARRLVLYDNNSDITITKPNFVPGQAINVTAMKIGDGGMHVLTAVPETGYVWQTNLINGSANIVLDWQNHFVNQVIDRKKLLNRVLPYPTQFADLQDEGVLRSKKYVSLDDNEGLRTLKPIENVNGIVKFEINSVYTNTKEVPKLGWILLNNLTERFEFFENLDDGSHIRFWVRATDVMNNTLADYTEVHIDSTPPQIDSVKWKKNVANGKYAHTSRFLFLATDRQSGVHWLEYSLYVGNSTEKHSVGGAPANKNNESDACRNIQCVCVFGECFLEEQTLDIDNCMFLVPKEDLNNTGRIVVKVYNQALLFQEFSVNISRLSILDGLEEYSGPTNIRVEKKLATGVRLTWDLPKTTSCYGRATIELIIVDSTGTVKEIKLSGDETTVDVVGLNPEQEYSVSMKLGYKGTELEASMQPYSFKTAAQESQLGIGLPVIAGTVAGAVVIIVVLVVVFVTLLKRGRMAPVRRGLTAMSMKLRRRDQGVRTQRKSNDYDNRAMDRDSLYMYGEMDFKTTQSWQMGRDDVILQSMLKAGSFANIYLAKLRSSNATVVAKTLKDKYSKEDELLMKAKINFTAVEVGSHENVLRFIGAVCVDSDIGPFIIYEYCSRGPLKDYLDLVKGTLSVETSERLLRFGLSIARGMEYLAKRKIVHRRLAARNILLDENYEVKIAGFGPQPDFGVDGEEQTSKRERIPIKWMAPECLKSTEGATEKSDVWSFGIVLWEIFSLGETPYNNVRGRELPAQIKSGYRLPKPKQCDDKWYGVMKRSWEADPGKRPTFKQVRSELDEVFVSAPKDEYYYYRK